MIFKFLDLVLPCLMLDSDNNICYKIWKSTLCFKWWISLVCLMMDSDLASPIKTLCSSGGFSPVLPDDWFRPKGQMYFVFCRLYSSSPQSPRQYLSPTSHVLSLLFNNTVSPVRACLSIWLRRGCVGAERKTSVGPGLLVFNSFMIKTRSRSPALI